MTAKELRKLRRSDLMEMLLELSKENMQLRRELEEANLRLAERQARAEEADSLTKVVEDLNGLFIRAQATCEQYENNLRLCCQQIEEQPPRANGTMVTDWIRRRKGNKHEKRKE